MGYLYWVRRKCILVHFWAVVSPIRNHSSMNENDEHSGGIQFICMVGRIFSEKDKKDQRCCGYSAFLCKDLLRDM